MPNQVDSITDRRAIRRLLARRGALWSAERAGVDAKVLWPSFPSGSTDSRLACAGGALERTDVCEPCQKAGLPIPVPVPRTPRICSPRMGRALETTARLPQPL